MISEERLKEMEDLHSKSTPGEWQVILGREGQYPRIDIYTGPKINLDEVRELQKQMTEIGKKLGRIGGQTQLSDGLIRGQHQGVLHGHVVQPAWYEQNSNSENDANFSAAAHNQFVLELIAEVRRLQALVKE